MPETTFPATLPILPFVGFDDYRTAVSHSVVPLDVHTDHPDDFGGQLDSGGSGDIHVFHIHADEHSVHRSEALIARGTCKYYKFSLLLEGQGLIIQDGRETALGAGDMAIYDTDRPYSLVFDDRVRLGIVMFPKELIELPAEAMGQLTARRFAGDAGVGTMVGSYLTQLVQQSDGLGGHLARRLARSAVDLVGSLLEEQASQRPAASGHESITRQVLDYIDDHLSSPDLCPAEIAGAHFISVRHLHALFSIQGTTVSTTIRTRRLERTYDELVNPGYADRSVTTIALSNGFVDPAHFSRTFRGHFGVPPSAVRPAAR
ncbi:helix-turn-helix domain-containing protein [Microbacterium invictum]|uniref:AraC-like DNA-binding protein n=1 Tax=Microbacterium invictum TaxID=515415 RepID=A0AA40SRW3_9MICO|nr:MULTISPECIES: helix-turn-helix domain-containing protein [Microbacterium]MBB4141321.1 AraC-like DNA-binding protein [Microbacterium invictum]